MICPNCRDFVIDLLDKRIARILEVSRAEPEEGDVSGAHCFHLMEIKSILEGKRTCGVFDDYGPQIPALATDGGRK